MGMYESGALASVEEGDLRLADISALGAADACGGYLQGFAVCECVESQLFSLLDNTSKDD